MHCVAAFNKFKLPGASLRKNDFVISTVDFPCFPLPPNFFVRCVSNLFLAFHPHIQTNEKLLLLFVHSSVEFYEIPRFNNVSLVQISKRVRIPQETTIHWLQKSTSTTFVRYNFLPINIITLEQKIFPYLDF